jgi:hypothetical protein
MVVIIVFFFWYYNKEAPMMAACGMVEGMMRVAETLAGYGKDSSEARMAVSNNGKALAIPPPMMMASGA